MAAAENRLSHEDVELLKKLDLHVSSITDNFSNLVKGVRINDQDEIASKDKAVPSEIPEVLAEKILAGGKGLLELTKGLKGKAIVSDHAAINKMREERTAMFKREQATIEAELQELKEDMAGCLSRLEDQYFMSKYRPPVAETKQRTEPLVDLALDISLT